MIEVLAHFPWHQPAETSAVKTRKRCLNCDQKAYLNFANQLLAWKEIHEHRLVEMLLLQCVTTHRTERILTFGGSRDSCEQSNKNVHLVLRGQRGRMSFIRAST